MLGKDPPIPVLRIKWQWDFIFFRSYHIVIFLVYPLHNLIIFPSYCHKTSGLYAYFQINCRHLNASLFFKGFLPLMVCSPCIHTENSSIHVLIFLTCKEKGGQRSISPVQQSGRNFIVLHLHQYPFHILQQRIIESMCRCNFQIIQNHQSFVAFVFIHNFIILILHFPEQ